MASQHATPTTEFDDKDRYFMSIAFLTAKQSQDPKCKVGACIVDENKEVISVGYNDMPEGCDVFLWERSRDVKDKLLYVCHAESNAILNKRTANMRGCTLYVTRFPCNECAKLIIRSGIRRVVYLSDKKGWKKQAVASKMMLSEAKVPCDKLPASYSVTISFEEDMDISDEE